MFCPDEAEENGTEKGPAAQRNLLFAMIRHDLETVPTRRLWNG